MSKYQWKVLPKISDKVNSDLSSYPEILRQILFNRNLKTEVSVREFLEGRLPLVGKFSNIDNVCDFIRKHVKNKTPIAIHGDYDVDGITATIILTEYLQKIGADARWYIPNRFEHGYGLSKQAIDLFRAVGVKLIITVDCGIKSVDEVEYAKQMGIDVVIIDHHEPGEVLPNAAGIIDPKIENSGYNNRDIAGAGLAYHVISKLRNEDESDESDKLDGFIQLAALGTIADSVPLIGENRYIAKAGINEIRKSARVGISALANISNVSLPNLISDDIAFHLAPRLNAAGRMGTALSAYRLLSTTNQSDATELARELDKRNEERKKLTDQLEGLATGCIEDISANVIMAAHKKLSVGIMGLVATRLMESFNRPTIIGNIENGIIRGSCRSIPQFDIVNALSNCSKYLLTYGGHTAAAGFSLEEKKWKSFVSCMIEQAGNLDKLNIDPEMVIDAEIPLTLVNDTTMSYIDWLQPFGYGNPMPVYMSRDVTLETRVIGTARNHLRVNVSDPDNSISINGIGFNMANKHASYSYQADIVYTCGYNTYNNRTTLQIMLKDIEERDR